MAPDSKVERFRRALEDAWNRGNLSLLDELVDPAFTGHDPTMSREKGPPGVRKEIELFRGAFPDLRYAIEEVVEEGERLAVRYTLKGTHKGDLLGIAPTGKAITITGMALLRFANGKVIQGWFNWDALGLMRQLGGGMAPSR